MSISSASELELVLLDKIDTVFPRVIAGGDDYSFPTKRSLLFEGAIISNIAHWMS